MPLIAQVSENFSSNSRTSCPSLREKPGRLRNRSRIWVFSRIDPIGHKLFLRSLSSWNYPPVHLTTRLELNWWSIVIIITLWFKTFWNHESMTLVPVMGHSYFRSPTPLTHWPATHCSLRRACAQLNVFFHFSRCSERRYWMQRKNFDNYA